MNSAFGTRKADAKYQDFVAIVCFIAAVMFFIWRAPHGFGFDDESWYLTFPHRLMMGDSLLTDEWNVAQLIGFLLYLPAKAFITFTGSTEGIILFFRYLFIIMQGSVSTVIYCRLRNYGYFSILAALLFFLHIPITIMALGYYSMGPAFTVLVGVLMATAGTHSKAVFFFTGIFFACAVLCNPLLVCVYFIYCFCVIIYEYQKNKNHRLFRSPCISFSFKTWVFITLGISIIASLFLILLFSRTNIHEIIKNFPLLLQDPEYLITTSSSGEQNVFTLIKTIMEIVNISPLLISAFGLLTVILYVDKKRAVRRRIYLVSGAVISVLLSIHLSLNVEFPSFGYTMLPLGWLGLFCYVLLENKNRNQFIFLWVFGLLDTFFLDIISYMGFVVAVLGLTLSSIACIIFISDIIKEIKQETEHKTLNKNTILNKYKKTMNGFVTASLITAIFLQIFLVFFVPFNLKIFPEYLTYYYNNPNNTAREKLDTELIVGPEKGIKTTASRANVYNGIITDLSVIKEYPSEPVLIASNMPWGYLYLDMPYATHSAWYEGYIFDQHKQRLLDYYKLHPDKTPSYIYIPKAMDLTYVNDPASAKATLNGFTEVFDCTVNETEYGYTLIIKR